jgi:hypothetical protein
MVPSPILIALIAAAATIVSATVAVLATRGPLHRMDVVSRVLAQMENDDPARASLIEVRRIDAEQIAKSQQSPLGVLIGLWLSLSVGSLALSIFGRQLAAWSPPMYLTVLGILLVLILLVIALVVAAAVGVVRRLLQWRAVAAARTN